MTLIHLVYSPTGGPNPLAELLVLKGRIKKILTLSLLISLPHYRHQQNPRNDFGDNPVPGKGRKRFETV